jgi:hypothetical protein
MNNNKDTQENGSIKVYLFLIGEGKKSEPWIKRIKGLTGF